MANDGGGWPASPNGVTKWGAAMRCLVGLNPRGPRESDTRQSWLCRWSAALLRPRGRRSGEVQQAHGGP